MHPEEEPCEALEVRLGGGIFGEEAAEEAAVGRDPRARAHHDEVRCGGVLGDEHHLAHGACDGDVVTWPGVTPGQGEGEG